MYVWYLYIYLSINVIDLSCRQSSFIHIGTDRSVHDTHLSLSYLVPLHATEPNPT